MALVKRVGSTSSWRMLRKGISFHLSLQLPHHGGWVPIAPHRLNFSCLVDLKYVDALENDGLAVLAGPTAGEFDRDPVAGLKDREV